MTTETIQELEQAYRNSIKTMGEKHRALETEAQGIISELTTEPEPGIPPMGINTPLADGDGYPRGDIDMYRARSLRGRLAVIKTDDKELMKQIDDLLIKLAAHQVRKQT
jgi:26S proteasome non-ATPase regulatory subunit 9